MLTDWTSICRWAAGQPHWTVEQVHACLHALGYSEDPLAVAAEFNLARGGALATIPHGFVDKLVELRDRLGISSVNV
jgi:hypothetical protein